MDLVRCAFSNMAGLSHLSIFVTYQEMRYWNKISQLLKGLVHLRSLSLNCYVLWKEPDLTQIQKDVELPSLKTLELTILDTYGGRPSIIPTVNAGTSKLRSLIVVTSQLRFERIE